MIRILAIAALLWLPAIAAAATKVGGVSRISGHCEGELGGSSAALSQASGIFRQQILRTAAKARLEITFDDATLLTLGEQVRLTVDDFVYRPEHSRIIFAVDGAMRFISAAHKPSGSEVAIRTPVATIGVRGTDFWSGPIDGQYGVLLLKGVVSVSNSAGQAILDKPGEGVNIAGPGAAPGRVTRWPRDKVRRALAAVAF